MARTLAALGAVLVLCGCEPVRRAGDRQLAYRAVFDLGCPSQELRIYRIDGRTAAVGGCGRRLVYVERCESSVGAWDACSWTLDTPGPTQLEWPQQLEAQRLQAERLLAGRSWPTAPPRSDLEAAACAPAAPGGSAAGRLYRTDLFAGDRAPLPATQPATQPPTPPKIQTDLFESRAPATREPDFGF